jgi:MoaA/NifB/PqqE/SkfB family radical SAM enzyme
MSLKQKTLSDFVRAYFDQDRITLKTYALICAYLSKFIKHPRFLTHVSKMPINFCVLITYRCTRSCKDCFFLNKLNRRDIPDMDLDTAKEIEASPLFKTAIRIGLLGGEPLLNENIYDIIAFWKSKGHIVSVTSNGDLLTLDKARELKKAGLHLLIISYYKNNRKKIEAFMASLTNAVMERNRIALACHSTNLNDIEDAYEFAKKTGIGLFLPRYTADFSNNYSLSNQEKQEIWRSFKNLRDKAHAEGAVQITPLIPFTYSVTQKPYCQNALMTYNIAPNLELSPCCQPISKKYGNIYDYDASEKFKKAVFQKDKIHKMCLNCPVLGGGNFL